MHHKKGRPHIKAVNELSKKGGPIALKATGTENDSEMQQSEFSEVEIARFKHVAHLETWILRLKSDLLADVFTNTENLVEKK
jgi:hypothetical protein